jgi:hypothetical protein
MARSQKKPDSICLAFELIGNEKLFIVQEVNAVGSGKIVMMFMVNQQSMLNLVKVTFRLVQCVVNALVRDVNPRGLTFMIQTDYEALARAHARQKTAEFKQEYSWRSGI